jgi:hypothetical protein
MFTTPDGTVTPIERVRIDNTGKVGIGTTAPTAGLTIKGLAANGDTLQNWRSSTGNTVSFLDSLGKFTAKVAVADTFKSTNAVKWGIPIKDFVLAAQDSSGGFTTYTAAHDSSQTLARNRSYIDFTHVDTDTEQKVMMGTTIPFIVTTNPDSVMFDTWGTAGSDSLKFRLRVKSVLAAGSALYDSGWLAVTAMSTWTHNAAVMPAFTRNEDYEVLIEVKAKNDARGLVSAVQFKGKPSW